MKPSAPLATPDSLAGGSRDEIRQRFLAAFEASGDGTPPDVEAFVAACPEPERSELRSELESVQKAWRQSKSAPADAGATVDAPGPNTSTVDDPSQGSVAATVDYVKGAAPGTAGGAGSPTTPGTMDYQARDELGTADFAMRTQGQAATPGPVSIPGYDILGVLGRGAMGIVYKASQRGLNRVVALKMILSGGHASEHELTRFRAEAEAVAQLQHPNIVQIHAVGDAEGRPFFALEFVDGESLDKKIRVKPLSAHETARLCYLLAGAMEYAHQRGIIHRDLKPANVLVSADGTPKVGDFGLAKRVDDQESGVTRAGTILGTPSYMAPEQAEGRLDDLGPRSDVYSLGAILYDLLTGRAPFRGTTMLDTLEQVRTREPVPPLQLQPNVPRDLDTICLKCLQKDPGRRYQSAAELAADLDRFLKNEPILARPVSQAERAWRWCKRNPRAAILSGSIVMVVIGWAVSSSLLAWGMKIERDNADAQTKIANTQTVEAERQTGIANAQTILAKKEKKEADTQRDIAGKEKKEADTQRDIAKGQELVALKNEKAARNTADATVKEMILLGDAIYNRLKPRRLSALADAEARRLREEVLVTLRGSLKDVSAKIDQAGSTVFGEAGAAVGFGDLLVKLGQSDEALKLYDQAHKNLKRTADAKPNNDLARANLGVALERLGKVALNLKGDGTAARDYFEQCRALHQDISDHPRDGSFLAASNFPVKKMALRVALSHDNRRLGEAYLSLGDPGKARDHFLIALGHRKAWSASEPKSLEARGYLMEAQMFVGIASSCVADNKGAQKYFIDAIESGNWLLSERPKVVEFKLDLAKVQGTFGDALARMGKPDQARKIYEEALVNVTAYVEQRPDDLPEFPVLAEMHERLGLIQTQLGDKAAAEKSYQQALKLREELWQVETNSLPGRAAYLLALARAGKHAEADAGAQKLRGQVTHSTELQLQLARCWAVCAGGDPRMKSHHIEQALTALRAATKGEFKAIVVLQTDPDLAALRDTPAFRKIQTEVQSR